MPLPSSKPQEYSQNEILDFGKISSAKGIAAAFGLPKKYLYLTEQATHDDFRLHPFLPLEMTFGETRERVSMSKQFDGVAELTEGWPEKHPLVVINCYPFVFLNPEKGATSSEFFLYHLLAALANRAASMKTLSGVDVAFLWLMNLEYQRMYQLKPNHTLIWGILTEEISTWEVSKTMQFLLNFSSYTRIILTSAQDPGPLLERLRIAPSYVDFFFNLKIDPKQKAEMVAAKQRKKKAAAPKAVNI